MMNIVLVTTHARVHHWIVHSLLGSVQWSWRRKANVHIGILRLLIFFEVSVTHSSPPLRL